jgi:hypothetical protein
MVTPVNDAGRRAHEQKVEHHNKLSDGKQIRSSRMGRKLTLKQSIRQPIVQTANQLGFGIVYGKDKSI